MEMREISDCRKVRRRVGYRKVTGRAGYRKVRVWVGYNWKMTGRAVYRKVKVWVGYCNVMGRVDILEGEYVGGLLEGDGEDGHTGR